MFSNDGMGEMGDVRGDVGMLVRPMPSGLQMRLLLLLLLLLRLPRTPHIWQGNCWCYG